VSRAAGSAPRAETRRQAAGGASLVVHPVTHPGRGLAGDLRAALPGWACARVIVVGALLLARYLVDHLGVTLDAARRASHDGLLGWDAGFYRGIAEKGYGFGHVPHEALRFFPLVPLAARWLGLLVGGPGVALLVVANVSALAMGAALHRLVLLEKGDPALASRAAWLVALVPPAFVLVMGYAEATFMLLVVLVFLCLRAQRWGWAALAAALAALTRPLGLLLVVPAAVEVVQAWRAPGSHVHRRRPLAGMLAAVAAPVAGAALYLGWVQAAYGDWHLPFAVQEAERLRGRFVDPVRAVYHETHLGLRGGHLGSGLHVVWVVVLLGLLVVVARRWPLSYTAFAVVTLGVSLSSRNLDSLERYALSCIPFVLAVATVTTRPRFERTVLVLSAAAMSGYALLAFVQALVP